MAGDRAVSRADLSRAPFCLGGAVFVHALVLSLVAGFPRARKPHVPALSLVLTADVILSPEPPPPPSPVAQAAPRVSSHMARRSALPAVVAPSASAEPGASPVGEREAPAIDAVPSVEPAPASPAQPAAAQEPARATGSFRAPVSVDMDVAHAARVAGRVGNLGDARGDRVGGLGGAYGAGGGVARLHRSPKERAELEGDGLLALEHPPPAETLQPFAGEGPGGAGRWYYERLSRHFTAQQSASYGLSLSGEAAAVVLLHELDERHFPVHTWRLIDRMTPDPGARDRLDLAATASLRAGVEYLVDVLSVYRVGAAHVDVVLRTPDGESHGFIRLHPRLAGTPVRIVLERNDTEHVSPYAGAQTR